MEQTDDVHQKKYGILYIDDEENNLKSFTANFRLDFRIFTAKSAREGRKILGVNEIGVIITDQRMPGITGIEFLESVKPLFPDTIRILLTGFSDTHAVNEAINSGLVYKYRVKPWQDDELKTDIKHAIELYHLRKENKELINKLEQANARIEMLKNGI